jgi:hypothetical protein
MVFCCSAIGVGMLGASVAVQIAAGFAVLVIDVAYVGLPMLVERREPTGGTA